MLGADTTTHSMSKNILIADDSRTMRRVLKGLLQARGNLTVCGEASNGFEAVEKAKELRPDLVLLDVAMPQMNGVEAASVLKTMLPKTLVILFTMHGGRIGQALSSAVGADLVISKREGLWRLIEAADDLLRLGTPRGTEN